jgi:hypothetical protein
LPTAPAIRTPDEDDLEPEPGGAWRSRRSAQTAPRTAEIADFPVLRRKPPRSGSVWIFASVAVFVALVALVFSLREDPTTARATPVRTRATPLGTPTRMAVTPQATPQATREETPASTPYETPEPTRVALSAPRATTPPRTPTPLPTAAAFGIVDINSDPWSEVLVNGQLLKEAQHTPYRRVKLPAGSVELAFRRNGTVVKTITVNVRSGENPAILVSLPR